VAHADEVGPRGARTLQILFDPVEAGPLLGDAHGLERWSWLHARTVAREMLTLLRVVRRPAAGDDEEIEQQVVDALGAAVESPPARGEPPRWIADVRAALDDRLPEHVGVAELARAAGTHAVSVSRAFRRHFGCSISEYRRRERLRRAAATIESSPAGLSHIAHGAGFADHAHLCREFREVTGLTPSEFRGMTRDRA
jgi:transcriptional regulator GlxA family with amidase domain